MPHISIKAEKIFEFLGLGITNSIIASGIVFLLTVFVVLYYKNQSTLKKKSNFYYLIKFFVNSIYSLFYSVLGEKTIVFFPLLFAFFFYILLQNWFGLLPGVGSLLIKVKDGHESVLVPLLRANTADLNTTIALAIISVFSIQYFAIKYLGIKKYLHKFFIALEIFVGFVQALVFSMLTAVFLSNAVVEHH